MEGVNRYQFFPDQLHLTFILLFGVDIAPLSDWASKCIISFPRINEYMLGVWSIILYQTKYIQTLIVAVVYMYKS